MAKIFRDRNPSSQVARKPALQSGDPRSGPRRLSQLRLTSNMNPLLEQATDATQRGNLSLVNQYLQQLLPGARDRNGTSGDAEVQSILEIALTVLERGDFQERWDVAKIVPKLGPIAIAPLLDILEDEEADLDERWFAGRILAEFDRPEVILGLVNLLETTEDADLAEIAASALANFGKSAIDALTPLLQFPNSRGLAARALAQIRRPEVVDPLLTVVRDEDVAVRTTAIEALASFRDPRIAPVLIAALGDIAASARKEAAIGLGLRADLDEKFDLLTYLQPLLYDFNLEVCQQAAIAISKLKSEAAEMALFKALQSPYTPLPLQLTLVRALAWMETRGSLQCLQQSLPSISVEGVLEIIRVLGRVETPALKAEATRILLDFYACEYPSAQQVTIKQALAHSWGQLKIRDTLAALQTLACDRDTGVRLHAIAALQHFSGS